MCGQTPIDSIQYMETYSMGLCYAKDGINIRWYEYFNSTTKFDQSRNRDMRPVLCFSLWHDISRTRKFIQKVLFQFCSTCSTSGHALTKSKLGFFSFFREHDVTSKISFDKWILHNSFFFTKKGLHNTTSVDFTYCT